jgi:endogenous inhibitor of DNA gyrase (YacG/DUF329 family)
VPGTDIGGMVHSGNSDSVMPMPAGARRCPVCGKRSVPRHRPFCSGRCADIDLGRWLKGAYRVESGEAAEDDRQDNEARQG